MSRPCHVLSLLGRLPASSRRFASGGVDRTWTEREGTRFGSRRGAQSDGSEELEDVEDKIQALVTEEKRRWKTAKYHLMRRKMTPPGAPQRRLTWEAMEQIRYLKQERGEEWTVERLAEGFAVPPDVVRRVLKSKFVPSPERRQKQNAKVMSAVGRPALAPGARPDARTLPASGRAPAVLPPGGTDGALVAAASRTQAVPGEGSRWRPRGLVHFAASPARHAAGGGRDASVTASAEDTMETGEEEEDGAEGEDGWDGRVLTERELDELMDGEEPSSVTQVEGDVFDADGNFLYRVPGYSE